LISPKLKPAHVRLLVLITTVWRNFQRRRLLRDSLTWCRQSSHHGKEVAWRFLLGDAPPNLLHPALEEAKVHQDMMLLGGVDEMEYSHLGDGYQLETANPELVKIVAAFRRIQREWSYDYAIVADDDSFVSTANAVELTYMLPPERVYVGNMIDTIPQRFSKEKNQVMAEYTVNMYLHTASKVPVFAHGLGFMVSSDVGNMLADLGLSMKMRGNDDMLFGVWLRSIEHLYYLHYWPWFHDHEGFEGIFSRPCETSTIIVHRMNPERWRTFNKFECHICGPPVAPLDVESGLPEDTSALKETRTPESRGSAGLAVEGVLHTEAKICLPVQEVGCSWSAASRSLALKEGLSACALRCEREAVFNATHPRACPKSVCIGLCDAPGQRNSLCPELPPGRRTRSRKKPVLAICVFGSRWRDDKLRRHLRNSLKSCTSQRLAVAQDRVAWVFVMGLLPPPEDPLREPAIKEVLRHRDLVSIRSVSHADEAV